MEGEGETMVSEAEVLLCIGEMVESGAKMVEINLTIL